MIVTYLRTLSTKVLLVIIIKPPLYKRFGRHSTTDIPYKIILYNYSLHKQVLTICFFHKLKRT